MNPIGKVMMIALGMSSLVFADPASAGDCGSKSSSGAQVTGASAVGDMQAAAAKPQAMDIVQTAIGAGSFKTLVAAVQAGGLVETLQGPGPFTVFAPTDEAFAKLPPGTIEELLKPENKSKLVAILTYHVVPGKVLSTDVVKVTSAKTVQGQNLSVKVSDTKVMIDNAQVVQADILASNGVVHVIDTVILPKNM